MVRSFVLVFALKLVGSCRVILIYFITSILVINQATGTHVVECFFSQLLSALLEVSYTLVVELRQPLHFISLALELSDSLFVELHSSWCQFNRFFAIRFT